MATLDRLFVYHWNVAIFYYANRIIYLFSVLNVEENTLVVQNVIANKVSVDIYYKIKKNNVLSLTYKVTNIDKKTHTVSIKSVFDTILGERRGGFSIVCAIIAHRIVWPK